MAFAEFGNGCQSPRISFSFDLSQTDRISPDKRKREHAAAIDYNTEFEFCIVSNIGDSRDAVFGDTLISAAELFVDGKILPQIREDDPITIARHLSLEISGCPSPVRTASYPPSKPISNTSDLENSKAGFKSRRKPSSKWKKMFRLSNKEYFCVSSKEADDDDDITKESSNDVKCFPSGKSLWPFSRSGREIQGNDLHWSLPISRSKSAVEHKSMPGSAVAAAACYRSKSVGAEPAIKEKDTLFSGSKPAETDGLKSKDVKPATKGLPDFPERKGNPGTVIRTRGSPAKNCGRGSPERGVGGANNGRFMVRNLERCSAEAWKSPRPGRPMSQGLPRNNSSNSGVSMTVKVSPVLNVPTCMGNGRNWPDLFGFLCFFSKKDNTRYHVSNFAAPANRKLGG